MAGGTLGANIPGSRTRGPGWIVPNGGRVRGLAITLKPQFADQPRPANDPGRWDLFWGEFDWTGWFKPSIDQAVSVGCNTIHVFGGWNGIFTGQYTEAQYEALVAQILTYIKSKGIYATYCTGDQGMWLQGGQSLTSTQYRAHISSLAANVLANYRGTLIAVDLNNEVNAHVSDAGWPNVGNGAISWATAKADFTANRTAVRSACPWLPCSMSSDGAPGGGGYNSTFNADAAALVDFWDYHCYSSAPAVGFFTPCYTQKALPSLVGEFGVNQSQSAGTRTGLVFAVRDNVVGGDANCMGAAMWAAFDQEDSTHVASPAGSEKYGLWDNPISLTYRSDVGTIFATFPIAA